MDLAIQGVLSYLSQGSQRPRSRRAMPSLSRYIQMRSLIFRSLIEWLTKTSSIAHLQCHKYLSVDTNSKNGGFSIAKKGTRDTFQPLRYMPSCRYAKLKNVQFNISTRNSDCCQTRPKRTPMTLPASLGNNYVAIKTEALRNRQILCRKTGAARQNFRGMITFPFGKITQSCIL